MGLCTLLVVLAVLGCGSALFRPEYPRHRLNSGFRQRFVDRRAQAQLGGCGQTPADIVFVLDESGSIYGPDFTRQLQFVNDVVDIFNISSAGTHIGVLTFATETQVHMYLGQHVNDVGHMKSVISKILQRRGTTGTDKALRIMRNTLFNKVYTREGIPHIGIVITDGESEYPDRTAREARISKEQGITMFAIGVGNKAEDNELQDIASSSEYVYRVENYAALEKLKDELTRTACEVTTLPPATTTTTAEPTTTPPQMIEGCNGRQPMDVVFALPDEAGVRDTELALDFIQSVVAGFKIGDKQMQVGLTPRLCADLDGILLEENDDKEALLDAIDDRGLESTLLSQQLDYLLHHGFTEEDGGRPLARNVAILLVDNAAADYDAVELLALQAKQEGITLIIVGIGPYINKQELQALATSDEYCYFVDRYDSLDLELAEDIQDELCTLLEWTPPEILETTTTSGSTTTPPPQMIEGCEGHIPLDVVFAVPDEASRDDTDTALEFVTSLVDSFWISDYQVQAGLSPRMCLDLPGFSLKEVDNEDSILAALDQRRLRYTLLDLQLEYLLQYGFTEEAGARPRAVKFSVLIVDTNPGDVDLTISLAEDIKNEGITLIVIGIGDRVDQGLLEQIASPGYSYWVSNYQQLSSLEAEIRQRFCTGITVEVSAQTL